MDLCGVVSITLEVPLDDFLEDFSLDIRPAKTARIEQHFANIPGKSISVPNAEMENLVPAEEKSFEVQGRQDMINSG